MIIAGTACSPDDRAGPARPPPGAGAAQAARKVPQCPRTCLSGQGLGVIGVGTAGVVARVGNVRCEATRWGWLTTCALTRGSGVV
eukprot:747935-Hanusia_phi.AAC.4